MRAEAEAGWGVRGRRVCEWDGLMVSVGHGRGWRAKIRDLAVAVAAAAAAAAAATVLVVARGVTATAAECGAKV